MLFPRETARISHSAAVSAPPEELATSFCAHNDRLFGIGHAIRTLDYESADWKRAGSIPFPLNPEQALVSTPEGLVLFGGRVDGKVISDLFIYRDDAWHELSHDLRGRANHACCWVPGYDRMLVSGGQDDAGILGDFVLVDLKVGSVRVIELVTPLPFVRHSVTFITGNTVCLFGGLDSAGNLNSKLFLVSLNNGKVKEITDIPVCSPRAGHWAFNFYGNLLVTGGCGEGERENAAMLFVFRWKVWLAIRVPKGLPNAFPLEKGFMFVSDTGDCSVVKYFKDSKEPFNGSDDPDYVDFLSKLLAVSLQAESLILSSAESRSAELLRTRRILYKGIASMVEDPGTGQIARVYANDIAERDRVKKYLSLVKKQRRRQLKRESDGKQRKMPKLIGQEEVKKRIAEQLAMLEGGEKMKRRTLLKAKEHEVKELFEQLERRTARTRKDDKDYSKDLEQVQQEKERLEQQLQQQQAILAEVKRQRFASDKNFLTLYGEIDRMNEAVFQDKVRMRDMRTQYYSNYEKILDMTLEHQTLKQKWKRREAKSDAETGLHVAVNKRKDLIINERNLQHQESNAMTALQAQLALLADPASVEASETFKTRLAAVSQSLEEIVYAHNERVAQVDPTNRYNLKLPQGDVPKRPQFTTLSDSSSLRSNPWIPLYSVIEERLVEMGDYYKKHKRTG